jgi:hypothetical protein
MALQVISAGKVKARPLSWLWRDRVPLGAVTIIAGDGGLGKSLLTCELAATLSRGELKGHLHGEPAPSLILSAEDDAETTITPRLMAAGADLSLVHVSADTEEPFTLPNDRDALAEAVETLGVRLVILDPLVAFLSHSVDAYKDQSVRRALAPLDALARASGVAVVAIMHVNRRDTSDASARFSGSPAFRNAARSALVFGADPSDPEGRDGPHRVLAQNKANLTRPGLSSLACRIEGATVRAGEVEIETARLRFTGESATTADELIGTPAARIPSPAMQFLSDTLADGPRLAGELEHEAAAQGITRQMLRTANRRLGVTTRYRGDLKAHEWSIPAEVGPIPT